MSKHIPLYLTAQQRAELETVIKSGNAPARKQTRARILLLSDRSQGDFRKDALIAEVVLCSVGTVLAIRHQCLQQGLQAALLEKPRPGATPKITGDIEAQITVLACSDPPDGRARWTVRLLTARVIELDILDEIDQSTVWERLKKNALKPWQVKTWCIGKPSAQYVAKMEDVLDVYARPYDPKHPVVCIDEGGKELRDTPNGLLGMEPGQSVRQDYEYERLGKANLFLSVEPLAGKRRVRVTERHTGPDFAHELKAVVDEDYPDAEGVVIVCDNLSTHGPACLYASFAPEEAHRIARKIEWHYTPEHGSWLNMAECELSVLARQCLKRRIPDIATLSEEAACWEQTRNAMQVTIDWQFTAADARIKLKRLYPVLKEASSSPNQAVTT